MLKTSVNYFKPPLEDRNPELLVQSHQNLKLKDILKEKHPPLHKVLGSRPKSSASTRSSYGGYTTTDSPNQKPKKEFTMITKIPEKKKIQIMEKQRTAAIINGRIQQVNRQSTYCKNGNLNSYLSQQQDLKYLPVKDLLNEVSRIVDVREFSPKRSIISSPSKSRIDFAYCSPPKNQQEKYFDCQRSQRRRFVEYREQEIQTVKSVFRPTYQDESLSVMFSN